MGNCLKIEFGTYSYSLPSSNIVLREFCGTSQLKSLHFLRNSQAFETCNILCTVRNWNFSFRPCSRIVASVFFRSTVSGGQIYYNIMNTFGRIYAFIILLSSSSYIWGARRRAECGRVAPHVRHRLIRASVLYVRIQVRYTKSYYNIL